MTFAPIFLEKLQTLRNLWWRCLLLFNLIGLFSSVGKCKTISTGFRFGLKCHFEMYFLLLNEIYFDRAHFSELQALRSLHVIWNFKFRYSEFQNISIRTLMQQSIFTISIFVLYIACDNGSLLLNPLWFVNQQNKFSVKWNTLQWNAYVAHTNTVRTTHVQWKWLKRKINVTPHRRRNMCGVNLCLKMRTIKCISISESCVVCVCVCAQQVWKWQ